MTMNILLWRLQKLDVEGGWNDYKYTNRHGNLFQTGGEGARLLSIKQSMNAIGRLYIGNLCRLPVAGGAI